MPKNISLQPQSLDILEFLNFLRQLRKNSKILLSIHGPLENLIKNPNSFEGFLKN